jgi:hypothetical protein
MFDVAVFKAAVLGISVLDVAFLLLNQCPVICCRSHVTPCLVVEIDLEFDWRADGYFSFLNSKKEAGSSSLDTLEGYK